MSSITSATPAVPGSQKPPTSVAAGAAPTAPGPAGDAADHGSLPVERYYSIIRGQIEHEDNLISTRLNWFITSQSFFFTAYAISAGNAQQPGTGVAHERIASLLLLVPLVAVVTSAVIGSGIVAGVLAMRTLRRTYLDYAASAGGSVGRELPPVQGYRSTQWMGIAAPLGLPLLFLLVWLVLLFKAFRGVVS